jgi:hypothetical protein
MRTEYRVFGAIFVFMAIANIVYGFMTRWAEFAGGIPFGLVALLCLMIATYLWVTGRRVGIRPEDRDEAEVHEGSGEQGFFSPWSWWPIALGAAAAITFLGVAIQFWLVLVGAAFALVGLVGWVFEYSRGDHSH